jgi:hypothetical protein
MLRQERHEQPERWAPHRSWAVEFGKRSCFAVACCGPIVDTAAGEIRLAVTDTTAWAEAVRRLDLKRVPIAAIEVRQPSLDDVFADHRAR